MCDVDEALQEVPMPTDRSGQPVDPGAPRLVLISPCRNEAETLERTLSSIEAQTLQPVLWVIVDDGSTDQTPEILAAAEARIPFLRVVRREDRGFRKVGGGVIEAFDCGLEAVDTEYDFLAKLDVDLELDPRYLEVALPYFEEDPSLAAVSGHVYCYRGGEFVQEFSMIPEAVAGCFKLYRREAFETIGGFQREVMWDGIDIHECRRRGLRTTNLPDEALRILHLRPMGASDRSIYRGRLRWGEGQWFMGSSFPYVLASGLFRMRERPWIIGGLLIIVGFLKASLQRKPRYEVPEFRAALRTWQWARLRETLRGFVGS